jgi:hypothetical protein
MTYARFYFALSNIYWTIIGQFKKWRASRAEATDGQRDS